MSITRTARIRQAPSLEIKQWFKDNLVYSPLAFAETAESCEQVQEVLQVREGDRVAGIASGGEIFLSFLRFRPEKVMGFDFNPAQAAVCNLKKEVIRRHDVGTYRAFFGIDEMPAERRHEIYQSVRGALGEYASVCDRMHIGNGILNHGATAWISRMIGLAYRTNLSKASYQKLMSLETTREERMELFQEFRAGFINKYVAGPLLKHGRHLFQHFFFPPPQVANSDYPLRALMDAAYLTRPMFESGVADNPVVGRHITGRVPSEHEELLYSDEGYHAMRDGLDRVAFGTAPIDQAMKEMPPNSVDCIYLSNAPDYLKKEGLESFCDAVRHVARKGARVFYLSLEPKCPFQSHGVEMPWVLDIDRADAIMSRDPVGIYRYLGAGIVPRR